MDALPPNTQEHVRTHLLDVRKAHIAHIRWLRAVRDHLPPETLVAMRDLEAAFRTVITACEAVIGCRAWDGV